MPVPCTSFFLSSSSLSLPLFFSPFSYPADDVWAELQTANLISQHGQGVSAVLDRVLRFPCSSPASPLLHTHPKPMACGVANHRNDLRNTCPAPQL